MASLVHFVNLRAHDERSSVLEKLKRLTKTLLKERLEEGDLVAVKLHFGERGNHGFLKPVFLRYIVEAVKESGGKPFLTDANTLYLGFRHHAVDHLETAIFHGFGYPAVPAVVIVFLILRDFLSLTFSSNHHHHFSGEGEILSLSVLRVFFPAILRKRAAFLSKRASKLLNLVSSGSMNAPRER